MGDSSLVARHYNARPQVGRERRRESVIFHLKNLNNWTKSVLIARFTAAAATAAAATDAGGSRGSGLRVLDLGCGKGGDLQKWAKAGVAALVGIDIAEVSVEHARQRYREGTFRFPADFFAADCFAPRLAERLGGDAARPGSFDVVSSQFAFHYCAEAPDRMAAAVANVAAFLRPGGYFVGTVPNANVLVKKLRAADGLRFGNSIYSVTFEQKTEYPIFGHRYNFELADAIDDCPEYLFNFPTMIELARKNGLELVYKRDFHQLFTEEIKMDRNLDLLYRMNVLDERGTISADEWEASGLYLAFAFQKQRR
ncbi:mRNA cap guanine-N7 methyltransferase [Cladochytrium tenue]|nr:mRNA cap guanine-N7 methyltransferase [Cladochytrium tenue]